VHPQEQAIIVDNVHVHYEVLAENRERFLESARRGFRRHRRTHQRVRALEGVSFELSRGDSLGLIGHNGSGKTTLLQVVAGLIAPSAGTVLVSAQPQILGIQAALNDLISGRRNIEMCGLALGFTRKEIDTLVPSIVDFTELQDFIDLPVQTYSAGMRQRLSFAISTVTKPEILLIDEALAVGDARFVEKSLERLREIRNEAGVVILATHSLGEIEISCNKALWLHEGKTAAFGEPADVIAAYADDDRLVSRTVEDM